MLTESKNWLMLIHVDWRKASVVKRIGQRRGGHGSDRGGAAPGRPDRIGLRSQLVFGLAAIMIVATVTVGLLTKWAVGLKLDELLVGHYRRVGEAFGLTLGPILSRGDGVALRRTIARLEATNDVVRLAVYDAGKRFLAQGRLPLSRSVRPSDLSLERQTTRLGEGWLGVSTPVRYDGRVLGVVIARLPLGPRAIGTPWQLWLVMGIDGLVLVLFVALVVSRYVARPIERMRRTAAQIAQGDLNARLIEDGAPELRSLARSFNAMTSELVVQRDTLIRTERLASVGRLAAGVAHEVGNPLQSIVGYTDLLLANAVEGKGRDDYLQRIAAEANRIHRTLTQLLAYAKPGMPRAERVTLAEAVEQAVRLVSPQRRFREIQLDVAELGTLPAVSGQLQRVVQVVVNLLLNAADANEGQGRVWVYGKERAGGVVCLSVSNDGPPIDDQFAERIFEPFFTTKEPGRGTGLGLAVSRSIAESMRGQLELTSRQPTTFELMLPAAAGSL